jgi:hypothetical protein
MRQIVIESTGNYLGEIPDLAPYNGGTPCHGDTVPVFRNGAESLCRISTAGTIPEQVTFPGEDSPVDCVVHYGVKIDSATSSVWIVEELGDDYHGSQSVRAFSTEYAARQYAAERDQNQPEKCGDSGHCKQHNPDCDHRFTYCVRKLAFETA